MDRAIVERAVQALAALNSVREFKVHVPRHPAPGTEKLAPCGSPHCAGCYDVGDGKKIHPPRCGPDYLAWLKRWEAKGSVQ